MSQAHGRKILDKGESKVRVLTRALPLPIAVAAAAASLAVSGVYIAAMLAGSDALDFAVYQLAIKRFADGALYDFGPVWYGWRYSPVAVFPLALVVPLGETVWRLLHVAAVFALPGWTRWIVLASFPFWFDVMAGNVMTFVFVATFWALRGNRWATGALLVTALLVPRPLMLPLVVWILWTRPEWRVPFALVTVAHTAIALATYPEWFALIVWAGGAQVGSAVNLAPSALVGVWWMLVAVPLAAWAWWRGRPALSGLLLQPYWLPYYLLMPLADYTVTVARPIEPVTAPSSSPP